MKHEVTSPQQTTRIHIPRLLISLCFTLLHYVLSLGVFLIMVAYASDLEGHTPPLSHFSEEVLMTAFQVLLFPFGYLPFGVVVNSALLGIGLYFFLSWRARKSLHDTPSSK